MKSKTAVTILFIAVAGAGLFAASSVSAQSAENPQDTLVQGIADRFKPEKNHVQAVFDENKTERQQKMRERHALYLDTLVQDGKLTDAQKQLILRKHDQLKSEKNADRETLKNMTPEQRQAEHDTKRQELEAWAKQNGIDPQYLIGKYGRGGFGKHGHR